MTLLLSAVMGTAIASSLRVVENKEWPFATTLMGQSRALGGVDIYVLARQTAAAISSKHNSRDEINAYSPANPEMEATIRLVAHWFNNGYPAYRALRRLAEKTRRANEIQHSGGVVSPEDWAELHQLTNEAFGVLEACDEVRV